MPLRSDWSQKNCSIARGLDVLGDPWSLLVLREVFFGNFRFDEMKKRLGVADNVLSKRLGWLLEAGLLVRLPFNDGGRRRQEYRLTEKGQDALPVLNAVALWSEKHLKAPSAEAHLQVIHAPCGAATMFADTCSNCGERLEAGNTSWYSANRSLQPIRLATAETAAA